MGRLQQKSGQAFVAAFGEQSFLIVVIVIIGRKHGILTGANRVMSRLVSATAAQTRKGAMTFASAAVVLGSVAERRGSITHPGQEQAGESNADKHLGDRLHI